jgi:spore coat protein CotH
MMNKVKQKEQQEIFEKMQSLNKEDRIKMLIDLMEKLNPPSRKNFFSELLRYVIADEKLTQKAFKENSGKIASVKAKKIKVTKKELNMINEVAAHINRLHVLMK